MVNNPEKKSFNGLSAKEWAAHSRSVWNDVSSPRTKEQMDHGATYPEKLCVRLIEMYSNKGDMILDPFLGTGTTVIAALKTERRSVGIELTDRFYEYAVNNINLQFPIQQTIDGRALPEYCIFKGNCEDILDTLDTDSVQLTLTSPPYANLIHKIVEDRTQRHKQSIYVTENNSTTNPYSEDANDLGNMPFSEYLSHILTIMEKIYRVTKPGGYSIWVVKDFRDIKDKMPYVDLHSKIAEMGSKVGFKYHDLIIWDQNERRKLVCLGYPSVFYVNQNNSFIVVLRK